MTQAEINREFTEKVQEYILAGYTFSISMNALQGELMKVDLTNGIETIRIRLNQAIDFITFENITELFVERFTEASDNERLTFWNGKGEIIEKRNINHSIHQELDTY